MHDWGCKRLAVLDNHAIASECLWAEMNFAGLTKEEATGISQP
jgi:hypothetical protein